jgi:hypothetical protein
MYNNKDYEEPDSCQITILIDESVSKQTLFATNMLRNTVAGRLHTKKINPKLLAHALNNHTN